VRRGYAGMRDGCSEGLASMGERASKLHLGHNTKKIPGPMRPGTHPHPFLLQYLDHIRTKATWYIPPLVFVAILRPAPFGH